MVPCTSFPSSNVHDAAAASEREVLCTRRQTGQEVHHDFVYELLVAEGCAAADGLGDHSLDVLHRLVAGGVVLQLQALLIHPRHPHRQILCVPAAIVCRVVPEVLATPEAAPARFKTLQT